MCSDLKMIPTDFLSQFGIRELKHDVIYMYTMHLSGPTEGNDGLVRERNPLSCFLDKNQCRKADGIEPGESREFQWLIG